MHQYIAEEKRLGPLDIGNRCATPSLTAIRTIGNTQLPSISRTPKHKRPGRRILDAYPSAEINTEKNMDV